MDVYGKVKKLLIVLNPKNKKLCYEYYWEQKCQYFVCCGCVINRKTCVARYHKNDKKDGDEYVTFGRAPHVCEWRKYDIEYFFKDRKRIDSTNFEVHEEIKNGVERKALIILSESDKTKCYKLYYTAASKCFSCLECKKLKHCVSARVFDDPIDKKQYAIPGKNDHICNLQEYIPAKKIDDEIVESSGFLKLQNQSGPLKIIVFDQKNKKLCYEFTCRKGTNIFSCLGCHEKDNRKLEGNALIQLCTRENGEEYLTLKKWNHCCKMRKYEAEKFQEIIFREPDFIFYREPKDPIINLAIFCSNDKEKFYKYRYHPSQLRFCCLNCRKIKSACNNFAKVCQDENGKEYLYHGKFQHICKPIPYSTITKNKNIEILKASGLPPKKPSKSGGRPCNKNIPPKNIDKSRIIKAEDFELQWSKKGKPDGKLVIFCPENKKLCYELNHEERNLYRCNKCVLYPSDYHITEMDENEDPIKFVIFIDADKKKCYTYTFWTIGKIFRCRGCMRSGTMVNAKIYKDKNEKNYMKLSPNNHVCVPEDYVSEGKDILPPQRFTLMPSKNGTVNGKLFLFDLEKPFYGYWFNFSKTVYYCCSCRKEGKQVKAKLCEKDDGEKYVEMYHHPKHVCEIRNILEENKVVKAENFKIDTNSSGEKPQFVRI
uniref:FLYWCH-type domain-containing protein n=1 Tax=Panagrolaimus superbus TaxID=310955 RepID=A0A914YWE8_9BILA